MNLTGLVLISWSFCSGSGSSLQEASPGTGEGDGEGCKPPQESPSGACQRTALIHYDSEKLEAEDSSSRGTSAEIRDRNCPPWLYHKFWTLRSYQKYIQHLTGTEYPQAREKDMVESQRKNMSGWEYRKWRQKWTGLTHALPIQGSGRGLGLQFLWRQW